MEKFREDEFEFIEVESQCFSQETSLVGDNYLKYINDVNHMVDCDTLKPNLFDLNHIVLLGDQSPNKKLKRKLGKR